MDHHGARVFRIDVGTADPAGDTIQPYDPYGYLHHLAHKDEPRERGQRAPEDPAYYGRIAHTVMAGAHIVVVGHGHGHSDAAHHLVEYLQAHHPDIYGRTVTELVSDLSALTGPQLLDLGRRALRQQGAMLTEATPRSAALHYGRPGPDWPELGGSRAWRHPLSHQTVRPRPGRGRGG